MIHVGCSMNPPLNGGTAFSKNLQTNQFHQDVSKSCIFGVVYSVSSAGFINLSSRRFNSKLFFRFLLFQRHLQAVRLFVTSIEDLIPMLPQPIHQQTVLEAEKIYQMLLVL